MARDRRGRRTQLFDAGTSAACRSTRALVVGRPGLGRAASRYELVDPARAGGARRARASSLRKLLYPRLLGACGRNVVFGQNVVLRHPHKIHIGDNVVIDDNCLLDAKGDAQSRHHASAAASSSAATRILSCKNGDIELGDGANIGFNCEVFSASRVTIGADTLLAAYCYVIGGDHDRSDAGLPVSQQGRTSAGVSVGEGAWMGAGAKVLDGVTIGDDAIVGAGRRRARRRPGARRRRRHARARRRHAGHAGLARRADQVSRSPSRCQPRMATG